MKNLHFFLSNFQRFAGRLMILVGASALIISCGDATVTGSAEDAEIEAVAVSEMRSADAIRAEHAAGKNMYVIERNIPGAGKFSQEELKAISQVSCGVLDEMGSEIKWLHSYVTGDMIYCVYTAPNEEMVREHAQKGGFPADAVVQVATVIDPSTAEK